MTWSADGIGPQRLRPTPVVVLTDRSLSPIADAGARRAGRGATIAHLTGGADLGRALGLAVANGADVLIVDAGDRDALSAAGSLGARPLAALPLDRPATIEALIDRLDVDVDIPLPTPDDDVRTRVRAILAPFGLEAVHHVVEVDPRPAFAELGQDARAASLDRLAAGAAGVLAGRLAAGNRRWRRELET